MLNHFVESLEQGLKAAREMDHERIRRYLVEEAENCEQLVLMSGMMHARVHHKEIPRALRYAQVATVFFTVESRLVRTCEYIRVQRKELAVKGKERSPFKAARRFLSTEANANVTVWDDLELARLIRNCISHANGFPSRLTSGEQDLRCRLRADTNVKCDGDDRLIIRGAYVDSLMKTVTKLFQEIFSNLGFGGESPFGLSPVTDGYVFKIDAQNRDWWVRIPGFDDLPGGDDLTGWE